MTVTNEAALCELVETMLSGGSANLQMLLGADVVFSEARVHSEPGVVSQNNDAVVIVGVEFTETLDGETLLALTVEEAEAIVRLMTVGMGIPDDDLLGEMGLSAISEAMNQLMAGFGRALAERLGDVVQISPPTLDLVEPGSERLSFGADHLIVAFGMSIDGLPKGSLYWAMDRAFADALVQKADPTEAGHEPLQEAPAPAASTVGPSGNNALSGALANLELTAVVELGRAEMPIRTLLGMDEGSVIRLGRNVDEAVDLLVNGTLAARGDIVLVDRKLGFRVREVITVSQGES